MRGIFGGVERTFTSRKPVFEVSDTSSSSISSARMSAFKQAKKTCDAAEPNELCGVEQEEMNGCVEP
jgi:hypothetical protein